LVADPPLSLSVVKGVRTHFVSGVVVGRVPASAARGQVRERCLHRQ
jgi:hypothetical protein